MLAQTHHPDWQYILWDMAASRWLLQKRYPWFLDTWTKMTTNVLKSGPAVHSMLSKSCCIFGACRPTCNLGSAL